MPELRQHQRLLVGHMIQIYTGDGKGKTSAALGTILRAVGAGLRVALVYFDKGGDHYSERPVLAARFPEVEVHVTGRDRFDPATGTFIFGVTEEDRREAERGLAIANQLFDRKQHDLVILDEICTAIGLGILKEEQVSELLDRKPAAVELILTGRNAPPSLIQRADLVTEMNAVKHYFEQGTKARKGIDY